MKIINKATEEMKIHVTRQFFGNSGPQSHFFEKQKNVYRCGLEGCMYFVPNFKSLTFLVWSGGRVHTDTPIHKPTYRPEFIKRGDWF